MSLTSKIRKTLDRHSNVVYVLIIISSLLLINPIKYGFSGVVLITMNSLLLASWSALVLLSDKTPSKNIITLTFIILIVFLKYYSKLLSPITEPEYIIFYSSIFSFYAIVSIILLRPHNNFLTFSIKLSYALMLCVVCLLVLIHQISGRLTEETIFAVLQSNFKESTSYLLDNIDIINTFAIVIVLIFFVSLTLFVTKKDFKDVNLKIKTAIALSLVLSAQNSFNIGIFNDVVEIKNYVGNYFFQLSEWKKIKDQRKSSDFDSKATRTGKLSVVIIGESATNYHMSAYGYPEITTPWIQSSDGIIFKNAFSNHTHTMETLSLGLTEANQYNNKSYWTTPSIIEVLKSANVKTAWLSTQVKTGPWDNMVSVLTEDADYSQFINESTIGQRFDVSKNDKELVSALNDYLKSIDEKENNVVFIHTMGSHGHYCDRIKGEDIELITVNRDFFKGKGSKCYDTTIKYTDELLEEVYNTVKKYNSFENMVYFSDHGEDIYSGAAHDFTLFNEYMTTIPLIIWTENENSYNNLTKNKELYFTNDLIFDTLLGLFGIESSSKSDSYDLSSLSYNLINPLTLHGSQEIKSLPSEISKQNTDKYEKLMAHRVNTIGSLYDAKRQGFNQIELDIVYDNIENELYIGHSISEKTTTTLSTYLEYEEGYFSRLWFDIKNIDTENLQSIRNILNSLDDKYNLKNRTLLETSYMGEDLSILSNEEWTTSYYIPTGKFLNDDGITQEYIDNLVKQLTNQNVKSISFDHRAYSSVVRYLNKNIDELSLELNAWLWLYSSDSDFDSKFKSMVVTQDERTESIIVQQVSRFIK